MCFIYAFLLRNISNHQSTAHYIVSASSPLSTPREPAEPGPCGTGQRYVRGLRWRLGTWQAKTSMEVLVSNLNGANAIAGRPWCLAPAVGITVGIPVTPRRHIPPAIQGTRSSCLGAKQHRRAAKSGLAVLLQTHLWFQGAFELCAGKWVGEGASERGGGRKLLTKS